VVQVLVVWVQVVVWVLVVWVQVVWALVVWVLVWVLVVWVLELVAWGLVVLVLVLVREAHSRSRNWMCTLSFHQRCKGHRFHLEGSCHNWRHRPICSNSIEVLPQQASLRERERLQCF
jgi:hypothetical protein